MGQRTATPRQIQVRNLSQVRSAILGSKRKNEERQDHTKRPCPTVRLHHPRQKRPTRSLTPQLQAPPCHPTPVHSLYAATSSRNSRRTKAPNSPLHTPFLCPRATHCRKPISFREQISLDVKEVLASSNTSGSGHQIKQPLLLFLFLFILLVIVVIRAWLEREHPLLRVNLAILHGLPLRFPDVPGEGLIPSPFLLGKIAQQGRRRPGAESWTGAHTLPRHDPTRTFPCA